MSERHVIRSAGLSATIRAQGAELVSLIGEAGEMLWHGGPEWPRHAPVLFPTVGRLTDDTLIHGGHSYRLTQHGFARDSLFSWSEQSESRAILRLADSEATRTAYPFRFLLELIYEAEDDTLSVTTRVGNPGDETLPCGVGAHPAFRWPLAEGVAQEDHLLIFEAPEPGPRLAVEGGLIGAPLPLPMQGRELALSPGLFANDALVIPAVASRSVHFVARDRAGPPARALTVSWEGYKDLGIWSKPSGAPFLCIEPWYGMASPAGWQGEFRDKPGILLLEPGGSRDFVWRVRV